MYGATCYAGSAFAGEDDTADVYAPLLAQLYPPVLLAQSYPPTLIAQEP